MQPGFRTARLSLIAALGLGSVFASTWLLFVFEGDQATYVVAAATAALSTAYLCATGSAYGVVVVIALATLVGTEARGELGPGTPLLGSTRILDIALLFAGFGLLIRFVVDRASLSLSHRRPGALGLVVFVLVAWAAALWIAAGAPRSPYLNTDVRLLGLAVGTYVVTAALARSQMLTVARALLLLSPLLLAKALLIFGADLYAIGSNDRVQASLFELAGDTRVVLVGGDTLLALGPALWAVLRPEFAGAGRRVAAGAAACAAVGVLMSGTRTTVAVAIALWAATELTMGLSKGQRLTPRALAVVGLAAVAITAGAFGFGVIERFQRGDTPHTGLNFRLDEIRNAADLPPAELAFGQGLGGTFVSKNVNGETVTAAWSHVLPVWLVLKVGVIGALPALALLALFVRRALRQRSLGAAVVPRTGLVLVVGLVAMSLTLGRVALPEGAVLLGMAAAFVVPPSRAPGAA